MAVGGEDVRGRAVGVKWVCVSFCLLGGASGFRFRGDVLLRLMVREAVMSTFLICVCHDAPVEKVKFNGVTG